MAGLRKARFGVGMREIWRAPSRAAAEAAMATFAEKYAPKYQKAVDCLLKDRGALLT